MRRPHHPSVRLFRSLGLGLSSLFLAALAVVPAAAQDLNGFLPAAGKGAVAISYSTESYDHFWAGRTRTTAPPLGKVSTDSQSLWFTWGFTPDLAIIVNAAGVAADTDGPAGLEDSGLQDIAILAKYRLTSFTRGAVNHQFLIAGGVRTPLENYVADAPVSLGDGSTDGLLRFLYHLESGRLYFSQQLGFDARGSGVPNGFPLYTELGYTFGRLTVNGFYLLYLAEDGSDIGDPGFTFNGNREELERLGAKLYYRITPAWGVSGAGFTTLDGRNSGDTTGFSLGLNFSF